MFNRLIEEEVDIYVFPERDISCPVGNGAEVTIGDLHGNMIKFLFFLVKQGVITNLSEENYAKLLVIYRVPVQALTEQHLHDFNAILDGIHFNRGTMVRLIGDELADRGSNDYFTLKLLEKLHQNQVPVEILISNHGVEFIEAYEKQDNFHAPMLRNGHADSMESLQSLIEKGLVTRDEVLHIVNNAYKPALRALSYSLNKDQTSINIYSHAGVGLNTIQKLAETLDLPYQDDSALALARTIDLINQSFQTYVQLNTVHTLYTRDMMFKGYRGERLDDAPFEFIMWNRFYDSIARPDQHLGYAINFVHGHDSSDKTAGNIYNLDSNLGKVVGRTDFHIENYSILYADANSLSLSLVEPAELPFVDSKSTAAPLLAGSSSELAPQINKDSAPMYAFWLQFGGSLFAAASLVSLCIVAAALLSVVSVSAVVFDSALLFGAVTGALSFGLFKAVHAPKEVNARERGADFTLGDML